MPFPLRVLALAALLACGAEAVDRSKFRTCQDAGFCRRHRSKTAEPEFRVLPATVAEAGGLLAATLHGAAAGAPHFALSLEAFDSGAARLRVLEQNDMTPRWEVGLLRQLPPLPSRRTL